MRSRRSTQNPLQPEWEHRVPPEEWAVYAEIIQRARARGIRFAIGGAFATAVYTGELRNTKDFDFYLLPADRESMKQVMDEAGLRDYFERLSYDRSWIYRGSREDIIVDTIWAMANHRADVDEYWLTRGPEISIRGERLRAIPVEELIWSKLYVMQRERCDWGDVFNLLDARVDVLDWDHLLDRLSTDAPLLAGALCVFTWLAPDRADAIPEPVRARLGLSNRSTRDESSEFRRRADLLDSRPWFARYMR
jgi:putative nucleotidyltransferase-like protein